jgi:hypothetical protein
MLGGARWAALRMRSGGIWGSRGSASNFEDMIAEKAKAWGISVPMMERCLRNGDAERLTAFLSTPVGLRRLAHALPGRVGVGDARWCAATATLPVELRPGYAAASQGIIEPLPSVPVQPIILAAQHEPGMFDHFKRYPWVLKTFEYQNADHLLAALLERVIAPAEAMVKEIRAQHKL